MNKVLFFAVGLIAGVVVTLIAERVIPLQNSTNSSRVDNGGRQKTTNQLDGEMGAMHKHPPRNVSGSAPVPTVNHLVFPDPMDGYNIQVMTQHFQMTPAAINTPVVANEGHAHLYVNEKKYARLYGNWYHLPTSALQQGTNHIKITLNANDHSEWAVNNVPISSTVKVMRR